MASTSATGNSAQDDNVLWNVQPYGVSIGRDYATYVEGLRDQLARVLADEPGYQGSSLASRQAKAASIIEQDISQSASGQVGKGSDKPNLMYMYQQPSVSDASIGGNDAINPHAAFCEDDDIIHEVFSTKGGAYKWGMGRVYSEIYDSKQQILYLTMGVPKYRNLTTWLKNAADKDMAELNENGSLSVFSKLGKLFSGTVKLALELPWLPIIWTFRLIDSVKNYPVTEYFMFRDTMPLYYRYVNTILSEIAVGMGIYGNGTSTSSGSTTESGAKVDGTAGNGANMDPSMARQYESNMPAILKSGPDILKIMCRRGERMSGSVSVDSDALLEKAINPQGEPEKAGMLDNFWTGIQTGALEGANFVGFRVERSDQAGETFSNSTQESSIAQKLNGKVQEYRDRNTGEANGEGMAAWLRQTTKQAASAMNQFKALMAGDIEGTIAYLAAGNGYFDLPKQWAGSAGMSRTLNFSMKLRSKTGGDNVSIFQSIMVPLSMLLAAALPRATGDSTYTAPFIVRAFCKGMYSIPAGIISSLTVTRGASEFGWSMGRLPTVVDVNFTIEDLSPMLFLSMAGDSVGSVFMQSFSNNTKMHEYLNTLTGIGCKERYFRLNQLKRRLQAAILTARNTTFSPTFQGFQLGDSSIVRSIVALTPWHRVKNN